MHAHPADQVRADEARQVAQQVDGGDCRAEYDAPLQKAARDRPEQAPCAAPGYHAAGDEEQCRTQALGADGGCSPRGPPAPSSMAPITCQGRNCVRTEFQALASRPIPRASRRATALMMPTGASSPAVRKLLQNQRQPEEDAVGAQQQGEPDDSAIFQTAPENSMLRTVSWRSTTEVYLSLSVSCSCAAQPCVVPHR